MGEPEGRLTLFLDGTCWNPGAATGRLLKRLKLMTYILVNLKGAYMGGAGSAFLMVERLIFRLCSLTFPFASSIDDVPTAVERDLMNVTG